MLTELLWECDIDYIDFKDDETLESIAKNKQKWADVVEIEGFTRVVVFEACEGVNYLVELEKVYSLDDVKSPKMRYLNALAEQPSKTKAEAAIAAAKSSRFSADRLLKQAAVLEAYAECNQPKGDSDASI